MIFRTCTVYLLVSISLALITCAGAQEDTGARMGGAHIKLSGDVGIKYTDNRDATEDKEENTDFFVSPRIDTMFEAERLMLDIFYAPSFRHRSNPNDLQNDTELFHDLGVDSRIKITPAIQPWLKDHYTYTDDPEVTEEGSLLRRDASYVRNQVDAGMTYAFSSRANVDLSGQHVMKRYKDEDVADESDETHVGGGISAWRRINRSVGLMADLRTTSYGYEVVDGLDRGVDVMVGAVGFDKIFSRQLRGGARIGYGQASYAENDLGNQSFPYVRVDVAGKHMPFSEIKLWVSRGIVESDVYPFSSQQKTDVGAKLELDTPVNIIVGFSTRYALSEYDRDYLAEDGEDVTRSLDGDRDVVVLSGILGYRIRNDMAVRFTQVHEDINSDVDTSYVRNTSKLVFTKDF